jgi:hypothetical protein
MKAFALDETSVSGYIYHLLLGHEVEPQVLRSAGGLSRTSTQPTLNILLLCAYVYAFTL